MKSIKIAIDDFWSDFDKQNNFIVDTLRKRYNVELVDTQQLGINQLEVVEVDYLFYSCMGERHLFYNCVKIFFTGECISPNFNECDYAMGFDYLNFGDRYLRYPLYAAYYKKDVELMMEKNQDIEADGKKFCSMVVSNSATASSVREKFYTELSKYKKIDSGGKFLNNIGKPDGVEDKLEFQKQYKFSLAFENDSYPGYCTEKIVQAYASGTIPIYWGDPLVTKTFNTKSFVWVDENNIEETIREIIELDCNDDKYLKMRREPAIIIEQETPDKYDMRYEAWLFHIIDQEKEKAYRIGQYGGSLYNTMELRRKNKLMEKYQYYECLPKSFWGKLRRAFNILFRNIKS